MANANPIVAVVFLNLRPLLRDVEAVQHLLDAADARMRANDANQARVALLLVEARRLAGVDGTGAGEIVSQVEEVARHVLEERMRIAQAIGLLVAVRALATARRRAHRLSAVLVVAAALAAVVPGLAVALQPLILVFVFAMFLLVLSMVC